VFGRSRPRLREAVGIPADAARTPLDEDESYAALSHLGVRIPRRAVVSCTQLPDELPVPAPAAVKVLSAAIAHKSDVGGVVLGVRDAAGLHAAAASIRESLEAAGLPDACEWLLVQEMADGVGEALIGFRHDPQIGPIVLVSAGGVLAELYRDRSVRPAPVTLAQAREMIAEVRAFATLAGYRGAPKGDLEALAHALSAISRLDPSVAEAEINPLLIGPVGDGVVAVDALLSRFGEVSS
jgi:hypothetical protein